MASARDADSVVAGGDHGSVSVWLDGKKVVDGVAARTKPDANAVFVQMGFHRNESAMPVETIFLDNAIEATTLEEVLAPANTGGAASGGAAGAGAGGGGASGAGAGGAASGAGGTSAGTGTGGNAGNVTTTGGVGTASSASGAGPEPAAGPEDDGSCSCRAAGHPTSGAWAGLVALAVAAGAFKRRR